MAEALVKLLPIFIGFALAYAAKRLGLVKPVFGNWLLKLAFYATIPALILVATYSLNITRHLVIFPVLPLVVLIITYLMGQVVVKRFKMSRPSEGTFKVAPLTLNSGFVLPFLMSMYGADGVARVILFNAGYNPLLLIGVYGMAALYSPHSRGRRHIIKKILIMPPLWALVVGLSLNAGSVEMPAPINFVMQSIGSLTPFLLIAALGMIFEFRRPRLDKTLAILGLRMGLGFIVGLLVVLAFRLEGLDRVAVLALAAAPIGFNLLTFASVEKLDERLAADVASLSILIGLITTPLILVLAK